MLMEKFSLDVAELTQIPIWEMHDHFKKLLSANLIYHIKYKMDVLIKSNVFLMPDNKAWEDEKLTL